MALIDIFRLKSLRSALQKVCGNWPIIGFRPVPSTQNTRTIPMADEKFTELGAKIDSLITQNSELRADNAVLVGKQAEDAATIADLQAKLTAAGNPTATDDEIDAESAKIDAALAGTVSGGTDTLSGSADTMASDTVAGA